MNRGSVIHPRSILPLNWVLLAMVAGLAALLLVVRPPAAAERPVVPLFPDFDAGRVTTLKIEVPVEGEDGAQVTTLVRDDAEQPWRVLELHGAPGNPIRIGSVLSWVGTMTDLDVVSTAESAVREYGLDEDQAVRVTLGRSDAVVDADLGAPGDGAPGVGASGVGPSGVGPSGPADSISFFASPASGGGAFVRPAGEGLVARVPQFPLQSRGPLSWFERDSLVPLESIQIRKVVASGSALEEPVTVTLPERVMTEFEDGSGARIPAATALELFRSLRATFPDGVIARPDTDIPELLRLEITPAVGRSFQVVFSDLGESAAGGNGRPGKAFQSGREYGVLVNPLAIDNVLKSIGAVARSGK